MEGEDEKQFICRYCSKRYPCGKSLGGHLRSHRTAKDRTGIVNVVRPNPKLSPPLASESAAYVLRENPKKTRRFADSRGGHLEWFCKECGKGFQSRKALCGHMACHSDKDKVPMDSQSDTDTTSGPRRGKRSKRLRYQALDFNSNPSMLLSVANEIEQEQEEVAMCLMLLSRDCAYGKGLTSFVECSDNSSVVLEAKSSSIDIKKKNLSSGFIRNGAKKLKSDGFVSFDAELGKLASIKQHPKQIKADQSVSHGPIHGSCSKRIQDHELWEICQKKIENGAASVNINGCYDSICESGEDSIEADSFSSKAKRFGAKKSKGHECPICFRDFKSGQALGGHKRSHFIGGPDDRTVVFVARPQISGLLDLNLPAPDEEEDMPSSWQSRFGGSTSMTSQMGLR